MQGTDPTAIEDHWQLVTKGGFYRGGPVLSSALALFRVGTYAVIPAWAAVLTMVSSLVYFAIAIWMVVLWRRYKTAWACRVVPL